MPRFLRFFFPISSLYLIQNYLKIFFLSLLSFVSILLVIRFTEIARLISMGADTQVVCAFIFYRTIHILPVALPISCLISAWLSFQKLSQQHELVALRAAGLSITKIQFPIFVLASYLSFLNFYISSELATEAQHASHKMRYEVQQLNPLTLLKNAHRFSSFNKVDFISQPSPENKDADQITAIWYNPSSEHLALMQIDELIIDDNVVKANRVSCISTLENTAQIEKAPDVVLETQLISQSPVENFNFFQKPNENSASWKIQPHYLTIKNLGQSFRIKKEHTEACYSIFSEIFRRIYIALAPLTLSFLGMSFAIEIGRNRNSKHFFTMVSVAALFVVCFFMAKAVGNHPLSIALLYAFPHLLILALCLRANYNISRGME